MAADFQNLRRRAALDPEDLGYEQRLRKHRERVELFEHHRIAGYRVLSELDQRAESILYRACSLDQGEPVTIKVYPGSHKQRPLMAFRRMTQILPQIENDYLPVLRDFSLDDEFCFLVLDDLPSVQLDTLLKRGLNREAA